MLSTLIEIHVGVHFFIGVLISLCRLLWIFIDLLKFVRLDIYGVIYIYKAAYPRFIAKLIGHSSLLRWDSFVFLVIALHSLFSLNCICV